MRPRNLLAVLMLAAMSAVNAAEPGLQFEHKDWELACDNTGTCRAAGYSTEGSKNRLSVLLTRLAGPDAPVSAQLLLGSYLLGDDEADAPLPDGVPLLMQINDRSLGTTDLRSSGGDLNKTQTQGLLAALTGKAWIRWTAGDREWTLSDRGATAVLLKMDEFQGRVGTAGALVRRGSRREDAVPQPNPRPVVNAVATDHRPVVISEAQEARLLAQLGALSGQDDCLVPSPDDEEKPRIEVERLSHGKLLASARCWGYSYNRSNGYWVVNATEPFEPVLAVSRASDYHQGTIEANFKDRGLGDCRNRRAWAWDGRAFVLTRVTSTGMCRLIAPGGTWDLPTFVADVVRDTG